jgi:hypothetical protein
MTTTTKDTLLMGSQIQFDPSGIGAGWRDISALDLTESVKEELADEIYEGRIKGTIDESEWTEYRATNGLMYRF